MMGVVPIAYYVVLVSTHPSQLHVHCLLHVEMWAIQAHIYICVECMPRAAMYTKSDLKWHGWN